MKTILFLVLSSMSLPILAATCSPYVTETAIVIANASTCNQAAKIAKDCRMNARTDVHLVTAAIQACEDLYGGDGALTQEDQKLRDSMNSKCSKENPKAIDALYCMLDVVKFMSKKVLN